MLLTLHLGMGIRICLHIPATRYLDKTLASSFLKNTMCGLNTYLVTIYSIHIIKDYFQNSLYAK